jgi:hypothetical protein
MNEFIGAKHNDEAMLYWISPTRLLRTPPVQYGRKLER